jgi:hypothetical protein
VHECGFCGKPRDEVAYLVAGPVLAICDRCVATGRDATDTDAGVVCTFCGATPACFVEGARGICPECLALAARIIAKAKPAPLPVARVRR